MKTHNVKQGTPEWKALRDKYNTASEAPAMMGDSKYMTRDQLMKQKHTGESEPVSSQLQALFDKGHATEAAIRPHIEKIIHQELFPATATHEVEGLKLLASFDGITMAEDIVFEHKLWNEELAQAVRENNLDAHYLWQLDQQLYISGAAKAIFVTSDGTPGKMEYCWYEPNFEAFGMLLAGWTQFEEDLANYQPAPEPELIQAEAVLSLPAVTIKVSGVIALTDNLYVFGNALQAYIDRINVNPETDQDFANLESAVKTLKQAEEALTAAENGALAQASSIDTMRRTVEFHRSEARKTRLMAEKLVKSEKENIKNRYVNDAITIFDFHINALNNSLGGQYIPSVRADFRGVIKGKRTLTSIQGAINNEMARAKIESNALAEKIRANLKTMAIEAEGYQFLFRDLNQILVKDVGDFTLLVRDRVNQHKQAEQKRLDDEREKIRLDEETKAKAAAQKVIDDELEKARLARLAADVTSKPVLPSKPALVSDSQKETATQPVYVVTITDKKAFIDAVSSGIITDECLIINTDKLTELAYRVDGALFVPGIKVSDEKAD